MKRMLAMLMRLMLVGLLLTVSVIPSVYAEQPPSQATFEGDWSVQEHCETTEHTDSGSVSRTSDRTDDIYISVTGSHAVALYPVSGQVVWEGTVDGQKLLISKGPKFWQMHGYAYNGVLVLSDDGNSFTGTLDISRSTESTRYEVRCTLTGTRKGAAPPAIELEVADTNPVGSPYVGVAADGVSEIGFVTRVSDPITTDQVSWEMASDTEEEPGELIVRRTGPTSAEGVFRPKAIFHRPFSVRITAKAETPDGQIVSDFVDIKVVRPPVVLIHGIWSNQGSMVPLERFLTRSGEFPLIGTVDYGTSPKKSNQDMRQSVRYLASGVDSALKKLDDEGIKAARVDIVAHSMGGLISRLYIVGDGQSIPPHPDKVRKLITLGTPHGGSPVADWYSNLIANRSVACDSNTKKFDKTKVTRNEINWFIGYIRTKVGLAPGALEFGEAVRQMQAKGNPGSIIDLLTARQTQVNAKTKYYTIAGNEPLVSWLRKVVGYDAVRLGYSDWQAPCGEFWRPAMESMVKEFLEQVAQSGSDGVVLEASALGTGTGIKPKHTKVVSANHFSLPTNGCAWDAVLRYLTDNQVWIGKVTIITTFSPGHVHVYDNQGRHVGLDAAGQVEIGIEGALYEAFSDTIGEHEFILVPGNQKITIQFLADEEGTVGLGISQGCDDGLHWHGYEDTEVVPGSELTIQLDDPTNPEGQLAHPDGETVSISPTHSEFVPSPKSQTPPSSSSPVSSSPLAGFEPLWSLLFVALCGLVLTLGGAFLILFLVRKRRRDGGKEEK